MLRALVCVQHRIPSRHGGLTLIEQECLCEHGQFDTALLRRRDALPAPSATENGCISMGNIGLTSTEFWYLPSFMTAPPTGGKPTVS